jgi:hypothetical protein
MPAFTGGRAVDTLDEVRRVFVFVLLAAGGGALALSAACGTLLGITPDDPGAADGSANEGGSSAGGGDGSTTDDGLGATLAPASISLVAGDTTGVTLAVSITRPTADPSVVTVTFPGAGDLIVTPLPGNDPRAPAQAFKITAIEAAVPQRETVNVIVSDGKRTVTRPLTILLAHHYRTGGVTSLDVASTQTYLIKAWGAGGGDPSGGAGGFAQGILSLEKGTYSIVVGYGGMGSGSSSVAGTPGGGMSGGGSLAKGGGGFSGLFAASADPTTLDFGLARLVAGAGGGGTVGGGGTLPGGGGGSTDVNSAEDGRGSPDSGASPGAGGVPGPSNAVSHIAGLAGTMLQGGTGGSDPANSGGGGGGGYYGGGGGGSDGTAGGGGSSFVISSAMSPMTLGGVQTTAGNTTDADRGSAGAVGGDGAVIVVPQ